MRETTYLQMLHFIILGKIGNDNRDSIPTLKCEFKQCNVLK